MEVLAAHVLENLEDDAGLNCTGSEAGSVRFESGPPGSYDVAFAGYVRRAMKLDRLLLLEGAAINGIIAADLDPVAQDAAGCLLANLIVGHVHAHPVAVPLRRGRQIPKRYGLEHARHRVMRWAIDEFMRIGAIHMLRGHEGRVTRIWPTAALSTIFDQAAELVGQLERAQLADELVLKNPDKDLIDYTDTRERDRLRNGIRRHAALLEVTEVDLPLPLVVTPVQHRLLCVGKRLRRIFNDAKFTHGGRFYGGGWQNLKKVQRRLLRINGSAVVELDYSGLHVHMLYHGEGHEPDADVYTFDGREDLRPIGKLITLIALNARTHDKALGAIRRALRLDPELSACVEASGMTVAQLYARFLDRHWRIERHFGSGVGVRLQAMDAAIMARVINQFTRAGIALLPVHDSAIVPEEYEDALHAEMVQSYAKSFPGRTIRIKKA